MTYRTAEERQEMESAMWMYGTSRRLLTIVALLAAFCAVLLAPSRGFAAESNATWQVIAQSETYFTPEAGNPGLATPEYLVRIKNVGSAPTAGPYTVVSKLSAGVSVSSAVGLRSSSNLSCAVEETTSTTITCTGSEPVQPGLGLVLNIPVVLDGDAASPVINELEIEGGGVASASETVSTPISLDQTAFTFLSAPKGVTSVITGDNGEEISQAGAYPTLDAVAINFAWPRLTAPGPVRLPDGGVKSLEINLPQGMVVNPQATPTKCTEAQLQATSCPGSSQVGTQTIDVSLTRGIGFFHVPIYNMKAPPGIPAVLGVPVEEGVYVHILAKVRSEEDYGLSSEVKLIISKIGVIAFETELWGDPTSSIHDTNRGQCTYVSAGVCPLNADERTEIPLLATPTSCEGPLVSSGSAVSYGHPNDPVSSITETAPMEGCNQLQFDPSISSQATTPVADSPTGLSFGLHVPQTVVNESSQGGAPPLATANLKGARVTLPNGMALNPAAANGLSSCSAAQIGLKTPVGQATPAHFDESEGGCPNESKIGSVKVKTPLLENELTGSVYLAKPFENPFGSLLAIYVAVEDEQSGIVAKLPGRVDADPVTGQLTTSFSESPELPIEDVKLNLFNGARASLQTPLTCGEHVTTSTLTPWTAPEGLDATPSDSFQTTVPPHGGNCPSSEADAPNVPTFSAGTVAPEAGAFSPFALRLARTDGSQRISAIDTTLPEGLLGKLTGIPYCPEASIALARSREAPEQGKVEQASPSCPLASEVGTVQVTAGAGITPFPVDGHAYLAGPYKGAPLSMVTIVPAVAGPFDLGDVVTRIALNVGTYDAQIHAVSDPLPQIIDGIPLDVRSIELKLDRPGFTLNPTSCEQKSITGTVTSPAGSVAPLTNRFQVGGCKSLAFKPSLKLSLKGPTKRTGHPALKAVVTFPSKGTSANIARAQVGLPHGEFLDNSNIGTVCTQPQLKTQTCPPASIYGKAKAWTPLLDQPLEGPVYLGAGFGHKLPDLVADLNGQIRVLVHGKVDTDKQGGIRNTFEAVPDAPVTKFVLEMQGGNKKGLLVNSENVCKKKQNAEVNFTAQNGKLLSLKSPIQNSCKKAKKGGKGKGSGGKKGKGGKKRLG